MIPLTLFLLYRPLEQLEFIRVRNSSAERRNFPPTRPQRFILPRKLQSRYRRHLVHFKPLFQHPLVGRSLNQLSRFTIHPVQEFDISPVHSRKNVFETNIVVIYNQIPQRIALPDHLAFLLRFSRRHRSSRDVCITTKPTSLLLCFVLFFVKEEKMPFWGGTVLECNFRNWEFHSKIAQRRRKSANPPRQYFWFIPDDLRQLSPCSPRFVLSVAFMCVSRFYFGAELLLKSKTTKKTNFQNLNQKNNTSIQKSQRRRKPINPSRGSIKKNGQSLSRMEVRLKI